MDIKTIPTAPVAGTNEQQTFTKSGTLTAGQWRAVYRNERTALLNWNATSAEVLAAVRALNEVGATGLSGASGGPISTTPIVVTFAANLGLANVPQMTVDNGTLVGGTIAVTTNVAGVTGSTRGLGKGSVVVTEDTGKLYVNEGTAAAPDWKQLSISTHTHA